MLKKLFIFVTVLATIASAAPKADFSGSYAVPQKKGDEAIRASLRVIQTESTVQVTRAYGDKSLRTAFHSTAAKVITQRKQACTGNAERN